MKTGLPLPFQSFIVIVYICALCDSLYKEQGMKIKKLNEKFLMKNNDFNIYCRVLLLSVEDIMGDKLKALELQNISIIHTPIYFPCICFIFHLSK